MQPQPDYYIVQGLRLLQAGNPIAALGEFDQAILADPMNAEGQRHRALTLQMLGRKAEAVTAYRRALDINPAFTEAKLQFGRFLADNGQREEAIRQFRSATEDEPDNFNAHLLLAWTFPKEGHFQEAEDHLREAIRINPDASAPYGMLGFRLQERGEFAQAIEMFTKGIERNPKQAGSFFGIVQSKRVTEEDRPLISDMEGVLAEGGLPPSDQVFLEYGLGKALDDLGDYGEAIKHFDEANRVSSLNPAQGSKPYDRLGHAAFVDRNVAAYTRPFFEAQKDLGDASEQPVFIVGMPRSGTTLVEQVLSSHADVGGAGELLFWRDKARTLRQQMTSGRPDSREAQAVAKAYLSVLESKAPGMARVTDKMPINFMFLGAIHTVFPHAKIILCKRHPVDTCLSIYMTRYVTPPEFANDRENIVFGYQQYLRLIDHWRSVLPSTAMLEVQYEDLVEDRESVTKRMLDFIGVGWDEACMHPEENKRSVTTPSLWQARQPVYRSSLARWKSYEPWLGAFEKLMPR
jgi:tetratricopeptide (TPR) repeat protein